MTVADDLVKLGTVRSLDAMKSVLQLIDDDETAFALALSIACNTVELASKIWANGVKVRGKIKPSREEAVGLALMKICDTLGVDWREHAKATPNRRRD